MGDSYSVCLSFDFDAYAYPELIHQIAFEGHGLAHHGWVHEKPRHF